MSGTPPISVRQLANYCRKLKIKPQSFLIFKEGIISPDGVDWLSKELPKYGVKDVMILLVKDINDIVNLDEKAMNQYGWFKVPQLLNALKMQEQKAKETEQPEALPEP